jgi:hypothetical protein
MKNYGLKPHGVLGMHWVGVFFQDVCFPQKYLIDSYHKGSGMFALDHFPMSHVSLDIIREIKVHLLSSCRRNERNSTRCRLHGYSLLASSATISKFI